jgi:hypothetical protein
MDDPLPNPPPAGRAIRFVKIALVLGLVVAIYLQLDVGLADQGDFLRANAWLTAGPVGLDNWLEPNSPQYVTRFFQFYLPYWRYPETPLPQTLWQIGDSHTSTALLWVPGLLLNRLGYSTTVLHMPVISLLPRLLLVGCLFGLFAWIDASRERHKAVLCLLLGVPLVLLLSTTDYLAYLNSFYQETGSMIYLGLWLAALVHLRRRPQSLTRGLVCVGALALLMGAKASNIYWIVVGPAFLMLSWRPWQWSKRRIIPYSALYVAMACGLLATYIRFVNHPEFADRHHYNSLYFGILTFSDDPSARLAELGLGGSESCVGAHAFTPQGLEFVERSSDRLSYLKVLRVAWAEPSAMLRMLLFAADKMQDIIGNEVGRLASGDPRSGHTLAVPYNVAVDDWWNPVSKAVNPMSLWSFVKFYYFPRGYAFLAALVAYAAAFAAILRREGFLGDLAQIGLSTTLACAVDVCVAVCGEGKCGLIKHLFLANLLFDVATIALVAVVGLLVLRRWTASQGDTDSPLLTGPPGAAGGPS